MEHKLPKSTLCEIRGICRVIRKSYGVVIFLFIMIASALGQVGNFETGDIYCGPRAVVHVLEHIGAIQPADETMMALIREMNLDDGRERLASLEEIRQALIRREIASQCYSIPDGQLPVSPHPIIVHWEELSVNHRSGHFVVLHGYVNDDCVVWVGPDGYMRIPKEEFRRRMSGFVLALNGRDSDSEGARKDNLRLLPVCDWWLSATDLWVVAGGLVAALMVWQLLFQPIRGVVGGVSEVISASPVSLVSPDERTAL